MAGEIGLTAMKQAGINTAQGVIGSGIQSLFNLGLMRREHKYQKKMLALQDQYQRKMIQDQPGLIKAGLMQAGYSTADPAGTGTTAPTVSAPGSAASGQVGMPSIPGIDLGVLEQNKAQARNLNSLARLNEIDAEWREKQNRSEVENMNAKTKEILDTLPQRIAILDQELQNKRAELHLNEEQAKKVSEETKLCIEQIAAIQIENKYRDKKEYYNAESAAEAFRKLAFEADVEGMKAYLSQYGIISGYNLIETIASLALSSDGEVLELINSNMQSVIKMLPDVVGQSVDSLFSTLFHVPKTILSKIRDNAIKALDKFNDRFSSK